MKISERLQFRLREELGLKVELPTRIRRGRHGISGGTWAWSARYQKGHGAGEIGSEDTMTDCMKAKSISCYRQLATGELVVCADSD